MPEFPSTTYGFTARPGAVAYLTSFPDVALRHAADVLVRCLENPPTVDEAAYPGGQAETDAGRRQQLANIVAERHTRARRENVARSMTSEDLQGMLSDFLEVAAVCGIAQEQAEANRKIVIDELRRRGVSVEGE
ncbi:hypothetical protein [Amycolatopsis vancoresmycina]|uniref:Uncharacterized protein n=1 Tax=Amycolatopsis vancoresmycina DSM 44592 TaxID=1292037 RepID=R1G605_9PSEU|nr:hypothetical protein [Amycolatopsis vancoresmycina]EOD66887.1 hypothetical protein H480_19228 [Amycolatopsis vancoresmycina DSM 44592]